MSKSLSRHHVETAARERAPRSTRPEVAQPDVHAFSENLEAPNTRVSAPSAVPLPSLLSSPPPKSYNEEAPLTSLVSSQSPKSYNEEVPPHSSSSSAENWAPETARGVDSTFAIKRKPVPKFARQPESSVGGFPRETETGTAGRVVAESSSSSTKGRKVVSEAGVRSKPSEGSVKGSRKSVSEASAHAGSRPGGRTEAGAGSRTAGRAVERSVGSKSAPGFASAQLARAVDATAVLSGYQRSIMGRYATAGTVVGVSVLFLVLLWAITASGSAAVVGLTPSSPIVAIMGETGAGKSSFIKALGGLDENGNPPTVGHNLNSTTKKVAWYSAGAGKKGFYILDTPGFDDSYMSDFEILEGLTLELATIYKEARPLTGVIYVHDISKEKMGGTSHKSLKTFQKLVGETSLKNVVLVTTHWPRFFTGKQLVREKELRTTFWASMLARGSQILRHDGSHKSALRIVKMLLERKPVVIRIVEQTVEDGLPIGQTDAGSVVREGLNEMETRLVEEIASVNEEMAELKKRQKQMQNEADKATGRLEQQWKQSSQEQRDAIERQLKALREQSKKEAEEMAKQFANVKNEKQTLWSRIEALQEANKMLREELVKQATTGKTKKPSKDGATGNSFHRSYRRVPAIEQATTGKTKKPSKDGATGNIFYRGYRRVVAIGKTALVLIVTLIACGMIGINLSIPLGPWFCFLFLPVFTAVWATYDLQTADVAVVLVLVVSLVSTIVALL
ncbi:hypothetical protein DRE_03805 [Drechslerella stenobrocha 248]|uniref:G domain-containing protein n=1 Tax=Drechslerella stenobrocha 248 TaxID=1043628 RepID=W7I4F2_9PEZI|nr:hypothetical protein DRE_03805 [Drechslerella stenobrocha 248]